MKWVLLGNKNFSFTRVSNYFMTQIVVRYAGAHGLGLYAMSASNAISIARTSMRIFKSSFIPSPFLKSRMCVGTYSSPGPIIYWYYIIYYIIYFIIYRVLYYFLLILYLHNRTLHSLHRYFDYFFRYFLFIYLLIIYLLIYLPTHFNYV